MTLVDPFVPVKKQPLPGLVNNFPRPKAGIKPVRPATTGPVQRRPLNPVTHQTPVIAAPAKTPPVTRQTPITPKPPIKQPIIPAAQLTPKPILAKPVPASPVPQRTATAVAQPKPITTQPLKAAAKPAAEATASPTTAEAALKQRSRSKRQRLWKIALKLRIPAAFATMFVGGMLLQSLIFGQIAILVYAVLAFVRRIPSSTTITLAGISLLSIIVLNVKDPYNPLISTFAVYAFLLLTVGVITLVREIYGQNKETSKA